MKTLNKLTQELEKSEQVLRFRLLEQVIFNDSDLLSRYKIMSDKQKKMVNDKEFGKKNYVNSKLDYENYRNNLMSNIVVGEYLTLLNDINDDLNMLKNIISDEVNLGFEE